MCASRFSGGFRDEPKRVPKVIPPLRERIDPTVKAFTQLEELFRELERDYDNEKIEPWEYQDLKAILEKKRTALGKKQDRLMGVKEYCPSNNAPVFIETDDSLYTKAMSLSRRWTPTYHVQLSRGWSIALGCLIVIVAMNIYNIA